MKRIVVKKDSNFTTINNEFIFNKKMSLKAKGLLIHLLAVPPTWKLYVEEVVTWHKDGKRAVYSAFKELIALGYLKRHQVREKGKIKGWEYIVYEKPHEQNVHEGNEYIQKEPLLNTNSTKYLKKVNKEDFDFMEVNDLNKEAWELWLQYKKEQHRFKYKPIAHKAAINKLLKHTKDETKQMEIIRQSIANGWKGLFNIKGQENNIVNNWNEARKIVGG